VDWWELETQLRTSGTGSRPGTPFPFKTQVKR
jgi:hypothetical protein